MSSTVTQNPTETVDGQARARLARRGVSYGSGVLISRVLGMAREILVARDLGTSTAASALVIGQTVPNLARTLVADDVSQGVLLPVFSRRRDEAGPEAVARLGLLTSLVTTALMVAIGVMVMALAQPLVALIGPGLSSESRRHVVIPLLRLFALTLAFGGVGTVGGAYLLLRHRYFAVAVAVAASNVPVILILLLDGSASVTTIAIGLAAGIAVQALAQRLLGGRLGRGRPSLQTLRDRDTWKFVRRIAMLSLPVALSLGIANLSGVVDTAYCSLVSTGGPAAFDKAFRLTLVPYGVIALAISVASVNAFIGASRSPTAFSARLAEAVRLQAALLIPAAAIATLYARPLITLVFARGNFNSASVRLTTDAMHGLGVVLPALGLSALGTRAWTAREMPWTPALAGIGALFANLGLDAAMYKPLGLAGIALSTAAVHISLGGGLLIRAVHEKRAFLRSIAPMAAWGAIIGLTACLPILVADVVGYGANTSSALALLAVGCLAALAVAIACPEPEYRLLLRGAVRR